MADSVEGVAVVQVEDDKHLDGHLSNLSGEEWVNPPAVVKLLLLLPCFLRTTIRHPGSLPGSTKVLSW